MPGEVTRQERRWRIGSGNSLQLALGVLIILGLVLALVLAPVDYSSYEAVREYGYLAVFVLGVIATGTIIIPLPYIAVIVMAGAFLDPVLVALVGAAGTALGEITGYLLGRGGRGWFATSEPAGTGRATRWLAAGGLSPDATARWYGRIERAMVRFGVLITFLAMAIPNPISKLVVIAAGATQLAVWQFLFASFGGRALRFWVIASFGSVLPLS